MKKQKNWAEWFFVVSVIFVLTVALVALLYGINRLNINYQNLTTAYGDLRAIAEDQYNYFVNLLSTSQANVIPPKPSTIDIPPNIFTPITQIAGLIMWFLAVASLIAILVITSNQRKGMETDFRRRVEKARELGHAEGLRDVVQGLVHDRDVLADVVDWLQKYQDGKATIDDAAKVHGQILERLVKQAKLSPVGQLGQSVQFDPRSHATLEELSPGESGEIVEVGWKVSQDLVKKPVVSKRKR